MTRNTYLPNNQLENMIRKKERNESVIVVLEGVKASIGDNGVAALRWALREVIVPKDELLVLVIINPGTSMSARCSEGQQQNHPCKGDEFFQILQEQINDRREDYRQVLRPYYDSCKRNGVKFQVKVAVGSRPKEIIFEEANNYATWVIMDRCFGCGLCLHDDCNIALINDDEEAEDYHYVCPSDCSGTSMDKEVQDGSTYHEFSGDIQEMVKSTTPDDGNDMEIEKLEESQSPIRSTKEEIFGEENEFEFNRLKAVDRVGHVRSDSFSFGRFSEGMVVFREPLDLSFEEILEITKGFQSLCYISGHEEFEIYDGFLSDPYFHVMVKRLNGDSTGIVEVEKQVTSSMFHRNILGLTAYHESIDGTALVYGFAAKGTLDQYIFGSGQQMELTFQNRLKIAIEIGQGLRYMHEECPGGPLVHGNIRPSSIFLTNDFQPLISGFGLAIWLQNHKLMTEISNRCLEKDCSAHESLDLVKSDVFAFGLLLLRLFCQRFLPKDERQLIEMARPLLVRGAFYELLDQDMENLDMYDIYRVMSAATQCTKTKPLSRPTMSQVVSILRGDNSCVGSSPSSDGSVRGGTNLMFY